MTLARSILINELTRLVSRNAEAPNINVAVAATFAEPNRIVVAYKQQRATTRCCTSAQAVSFNERPIFERCNPTMLRRPRLNGMDSAEVG